MDEASHLAELAEQCREKASNTPPSFSRTKHLRRAEFLEQAAREKATLAKLKSIDSHRRSI
jgi:hypothetical protein